MVQRILPPYRVPLFQRLAGSAALSVAVACGDADPRAALRSVTTVPGLEVVRLRNWHPWSGNAWVVQRGLLGALRQRRPRAVIAEFNPRIVSNLAALGYARLTGLPFLWWGHGLSPTSGRFARRVRAWLARRADGVILYDAAQVRALVGLGVPADQLIVAPNAIDTEAIAGLAAPWEAGPRPLVLYVGRLIRAKKVALLIEAFASALPRLPAGTQLMIIGDGAERTALERLAGARGVSAAVTFTGEVLDEVRLAPLFNRAWVSVSPGYVGLAAIHSLAYGVPLVIAADEPHSPEIGAVEAGINARLVPSDAPAALAAALIDLAGDADRLAAMSAAGRRTVGEGYSLTGMVAAFEAAVERASASRRRQASP
ncbi:MAG: glycosyltransferase family 4 protein [Gemmatimonadota bacterium]